MRALHDHAQPLADEVVGDFVHLDVRREVGTRQAPERLVDRVREARLERGVEHRVQQDPVARVAVDVEGRVQLHDAFGERAGLVGAQHVHAAEVLDRVEAAHDHVRCGHPLRAARERDAHDGGEKLRSEADREREREEERVHDRPVQIHVDAEDRDHEEQRDLDQHPAEVPEPALELGLGRAEPELLGDLAEHGVRAGLHDHGTAGAAHHVRALEQRVRSLRERRIVGEVARALLGGVALSGQRGFVHEEVGGMEDAAVGRDGRARRENDHVPRHESVLRQLDLAAVAKDPHRRLDDRQQLGDRIARPVLLQEAEQGAAEHDREDDHAVRRLAEEERERHREQQEDDQRAPELVQQEPERSDLADVGAAIGTEVQQPPVGLDLGQAIRDGCRARREPSRSERPRTVQASASASAARRQEPTRLGHQPHTGRHAHRDFWDAHEGSG